MKPKHLASYVCRSFTGLLLLAALMLHALPAARLSAAENVALGKPPRLDSPDQTPEGLSKSDWASIRAAYEAGRHAFMPIEGGWQARNPGQQWTTKLDGRGFLATPREGDWTWGLELRSYGFGDNQTPVGLRAPQVKAEGQRLTYQWDANVQEWWVNDLRGLEHGYCIHQRPDYREVLECGSPLPLSERDTGPKRQRTGPVEDTGAASDASLSLILATRGNLSPKVSPDGLGVLFQNATGTTVLNYTGLKVWDADGKTLPTRFETVKGRARHSVRADFEPTDTNPASRRAEDCAPYLRLLVDDRGARYPITIDPIAQQAYLKAHQVSAIDYFGQSVAVDGDTVVVGAPGEASSTTGVNSTPNESAEAAGAAYVFVRSGTTWTQQAYLKAHRVSAFDYFGWSVAVSGDTVVVGATDEDSSTTGVNSPPNESAQDAGAAYVFVRSGTNWSQQAYLKAHQVSAFDYFGRSVAVSGDTLVIGAFFEDSNTTGVNSTPDDVSDFFNSGAAYVFVRSGTNWTQQAYLKAHEVSGNELFGWSVAVSGDTVVVGASQEASSTTGVNSAPNENAFAAGAAYVFVRSGTNWTQQAYLKAHQVSAFDYFGWSVAVSGDTVVVGAPLEASSTTGINSTPNESAGEAGATYVFVRSGTNWSQQAYLKAHQVSAGDRFGNSVAVRGDTVVVGAWWEDSSTTGVNSTPNESAGEAGAAYVFVRSGMTWSQQAYLKAHQVSAVDYFGLSVAVSGDTVVVGAIWEESSTTGVNSTPNESAIDAGAVYVFTGLGPALPPTLSIVASGPEQFTLSWTPSTPGFALQESLSLSAVGWSNSPSGETNPITLPAAGSAKFFRLTKP